jgi:hypothetical protein
LVVCSLAALLAVGAAARRTYLQRGAATYKDSPWPQQPGYTWRVGRGTVTVATPPSRPGASPATATFEWELPKTVPAAGAKKGELKITATAGDKDSWAPSFRIEGKLVGCTGIKNTPSYGSGCADGRHAAVGVSLEPSQTRTVFQKFLIKGRPGIVTIVTTAPKNVVYLYTRRTR